MDIYVKSSQEKEALKVLQEAGVEPIKTWLGFKVRSNQAHKAKQALENNLIVAYYDH